MNIKRYIALLGLIAILAMPVIAQDSIPAHPDELVFPELKYDPPAKADYHTTLSNGMSVYIAEDHDAPVVEITLTARTGSHWEPDDKVGIAAATGYLMRAGGTESMTPQELDARLNFLAARISTSIGDDRGTASLWVLKKDLDEGMKLFRDVIKTPRFDPQVVALMKMQVALSLRGVNDSTQAIEGREWAQLMYGDHPSTRQASLEIVQGVTRDDLVAFHSEYFYPSNFTVAISGDFKKDEMLQRLEAFFSDWEDKPAKELTVPDAPHTPAPGVYVVNKPEVNQGRVRIGHRGITYDHPDRWALQLGNFILGGGSFTSRLQQTVRSDHGLAYSIGSGISPALYYPNDFIMLFQSKSETCAFAASLCRKELIKAIEEGVTAEELQAAKNYFVESFPRRWSNKHAIVSSLASQEYSGLPENYWFTYRDNINAVTVETVKDAFKRNLHPDNLVVLAVGDVETMLKGDGEHDADLSEFGPITELSFRDPKTMKYVEEPKPWGAGAAEEKPADENPADEKSMNGHDKKPSDASKGAEENN